jgi:hypothetical protein
MIRYEKKVPILAAALGVLMLTWGLGLFFSPERLAERSEAASLLTGKVENAAYVEIKAGEKLAFEKQGESWFMLDSPRREVQNTGTGTAPGVGAAAAPGSASVKFPAQGSRIKSLLDSVAAVKRLRLLARSKEAWSGFQLDDTVAKRLVVRDARGGTIADIATGGYGPTGSEIYIRRAGTDESYAAAADFASYLGYGRKNWLDLQILPPTSDSDIQSISLRSSVQIDVKDKAAIKLDYALKREGQNWVVTGGAAGQNLDPASVQTLIRSILALEGEDFVAAPQANAFTPVAVRIELSLGSGASRVIEVGSPAGDGRFHLRLAGGPYTYQVSAYSIRNLLKAPGELAQKK